MSEYRERKKYEEDQFELSYEEIRQMYLENERDRRECEQITQGTCRGENFYTNQPGQFFHDFAKEILYRDPKTAGFTMRYPHGIVIQQGRRNNFYRGENQIFESSVSTLHRKLRAVYQSAEGNAGKSAEGNAEENKKREVELYKFVAQMRIYEFLNFIAHFGIVRFWSENYGDVLYEALAQHYGLETFWLDVTDDFNVALFFATCYYDVSQKKFLPLTKEQTEKNERTKYGMLFRIPEWRATEELHSSVLDMDTGEDTYPILHNVILPIGFQPFQRCHMQHAYGIRQETAYPLQEDHSFEKLRFRHSEKLSKEVYEMMDQGKKIYPHEGLSGFDDQIDLIRNTTAFNREIFERSFEENSYFTDIEELEKLMEGRYTILEGKEHPFHLSRQRLRRMEQKCVGFSIEKTYGIKQTYRMARGVGTADWGIDERER